MSDKEAKVEPQKNYLKRSKLKYGEAYRTTKTFAWSNYDQRMEKVVVPVDALLIYRVSKPTYQKDHENVLFVWLDKKITICLSTNEKSILYVRHVEWDKRHKTLDVTEREDDTQPFKIIPKGAFKEDSNSDERESLDS